MYYHKTSFVLGFHGCDERVRDALLNGKTELAYSRNDWDWLGHGIYFWHNYIEELKIDEPYDSVRGVFFEGDEIYENAGFREKNHVQICVRNPNCIKGYFLPKESNSDFKIL